MNTLEEVISELETVDKKLGSTMGWFFKKRLIKKSDYLHTVMDQLLIECLSNENNNFRSLVDENQDLLANDEIHFKVTNEGASPWTYLTSRFEGQIHRNGYLYLMAKSNSIEFLEILSHFYPRSYLGTLDVMGKARVSADTTDFQIFGGRVPDSFIGKISRDGSLKFSTAGSWFEIDGHVHVDRIIADPFNGSSRKRQAFLRNRREMGSCMRDWKSDNNIRRHRL